MTVYLDEHDMGHDLNSIEAHAVKRKSSINVATAKDLNVIEV